MNAEQRYIKSLINVMAASAVEFTEINAEAVAKVFEGRQPNTQYYINVVTEHVEKGNITMDKIKAAKVYSGDFNDLPEIVQNIILEFDPECPTKSFMDIEDELSCVGWGAMLHGCRVGSAKELEENRITFYQAKKYIDPSYDIPENPDAYWWSLEHNSMEVNSSMELNFLHEFVKGWINYKELPEESLDEIDPRLLSTEDRAFASYLIELFHNDEVICNTKDLPPAKPTEIYVIAHTWEDVDLTIDKFYSNDEALTKMKELVKDEYQNQNFEGSAADFLGEYYAWVREENDNMCSVDICLEVIELEY